MKNLKLAGLVGIFSFLLPVCAMTSKQECDKAKKIGYGWEGGECRFTCENIKGKDAEENCKKRQEDCKWCVVCREMSAQCLGKSKACPCSCNQLGENDCKKQTGCFFKEEGCVAEG